MQIFPISISANIFKRVTKGLADQNIFYGDRTGLSEALTTTGQLQGKGQTFRTY
jgi:hypothetical protein